MVSESYRLSYVIAHQTPLTADGANRTNCQLHPVRVEGVCIKAGMSEFHNKQRQGMTVGTLVELEQNASKNESCFGTTGKPNQQPHCGAGNSEWMGAGCTCDWGCRSRSGRSGPDVKFNCGTAGIRFRLLAKWVSIVQQVRGRSSVRRLAN